MPNACEPYIPEYGECDAKHFASAEKDLDVWQAAMVVREAARCIADTGVCPDAYKHNGKWGLGTCNSKAPEGIVIGPPPEVAGDCCGSITVAIRYPNTIEPDDCFFTPFNVEYQTKITWPCDWHPYMITVETSRFARLLADTICCKWPPTANKNVKKPKARLVGTEDDNPDECQSMVYTIEIR